MPGGPTIVGVTAFGAVKVAGYLTAGYVLKRRYKQPSVNALGFGLARTALGIFAGVTFASLALSVGIPNMVIGFYLLLAPVRFGEWFLAIWAFFEVGHLEFKRLVINSIFGSLWSYVLDLPAMLSLFLVPGGFWIC